MRLGSLSLRRTVLRFQEMANDRALQLGMPLEIAVVSSTGPPRHISQWKPIRARSWQVARFEAGAHRFETEQSLH